MIYIRILLLYKFLYQNVSVTPPLDVTKPVTKTLNFHEWRRPFINFTAKARNPVVLCDLQVVGGSIKTTGPNAVNLVVFRSPVEYRQGGFFMYFSVVRRLQVLPSIYRVVSLPSLLCALS